MLAFGALDPPTRSLTTTAPAANRATWHVASDEPGEWMDALRACGGGFFHVPAGLTVGGRSGRPLFARLATADGATSAVALGVLSRCRLSRKAMHAAFPSLPACAAGIEPASVLPGLRDALSEIGVAEAAFDSFDASWLPPEGESSSPRLEYIVPVAATDEILARMSSTHRRYARKGDRDGFSMRFLLGREAADAIRDVQLSTSERAASRSRGFRPGEAGPWEPFLVESAPLPPSGMMVCAAFAEGELLAAVLVGWAAGRSFYVMGGSTPDGYKRTAAPWLHLRVLELLHARGVTAYNLGGTPPGADAADHPAHGLYRFKTGFGVEPEPRAGMRWELNALHMRLHGLLRRVGG